MHYADFNTRKDVINSPTEVRQLIVEDYSSARRDDPGTKSGEKMHEQDELDLSNAKALFACHLYFKK